MADGVEQVSVEDYGPILAGYLREHSEEALYRAGILSHHFIESGLGPEDIIALHFDALERVLRGLPYREQAHASLDAYQFLLEVMIAYGVKYKEYLELKLAETLRDAEARAMRDRERVMEAERLQREKSEILGMIAHELRTPITAAKGSIDLVSHMLSRGQLEPLPKFLGRAREAINRLSRLSADLVEASRGEHPDLELTTQDLTTIVDQAYSWAQPSALAKGITLGREGSTDPLILRANADALLSVFGNLLSNAIRYTSPGGRVTVRQESAGEDVCVVVADTGIGMSAETQGRIFEKFYRGAEARQMEAQGLGLGLALVQQLVQAHGGRIGLTSVPGEGTTFRVLLPRGAQDEQAPQGGEQERAGTQ